jgi:hypothetical protein
MGVGGLLAVPAKTARDAARPAERAVVRRQAGGERRVATRPRPDERSDLSNLLAAAWWLTGGCWPVGGGMVLPTEAPASTQRRLTTHEQIRGRAGDSQSRCQRAQARRGAPPCRQHGQFTDSTRKVACFYRLPSAQRIRYARTAPG